MAATGYSIAPTRPAPDRPGRLAGFLARPWFLLVPALLILVPAFILPIGKLLGTSFGEDGFSLQNYAVALGDPGYMALLYRSLAVSLQVTLLTALIGYPLAYAIANAPERARNALLLLVAIPLWTSTLVRSFSWIILLGREGLFNSVASALGLIDQPVQLLYTRTAVLIGFVHVMLPYLVFPLVSVMRQIPPNLTAVSTSLGAGRFSAFWLIFFPLSLPGVLSGAVLVFVLCTGFFVTPALLGGLQDMNYVMLIQQQVEVVMDWPLAAAMSVILLVVTLFFVLLFGRFIRAGGEAGSHAAQTRHRSWLIGPACVTLGKLGALIRRRARRDAARGHATRRLGVPAQVYALAAIGFLIVPIFMLIPLSLSAAPYLQFPPTAFSLRWYENFFSRPDWLAAARTSLQIGLVVAAIATAVGTAAAVAFSRSTHAVVRAIYPVMISPIIIPTLIISVALYFALAPFGLIGSSPAIILGHIIIALPIVVVIVMGSLKRVNLGPERAARSLGAGPIRAFMATTFPAIRPGVISAALFAFLTSFDDVVIVLFIGGSNSTLPKRMWDGVQLEIDPTIAAASSLLVLISVAMTFALLALRRRDTAGPDKS